MNASSSAIDEYLAGVPEPARTTLSELRRTVRDVVPEAVEVFGYGMPGYKFRGRPLVYFAAAKNHCALYGLDAGEAKRAGYDAEKGTIRFPPNSPPDDSLVRKLLRRRIAAIEAAQPKKPRNPRARA